jgi:hypothetical protein
MTGFSLSADGVKRKAKMLEPGLMVSSKSEGGGGGCGLMLQLRVSGTQ